jgi:hypothetical protein
MRPSAPSTDLRPVIRRDEIPRPEDSVGTGRDLRRRGRGRGFGRSEEDRLTKEVLDRLLSEDQALRNVRSGRVDPLVYEIARDADKTFAPPWKLVEDDSRGRGTIGATGKSLLRGWFRSYLSGLRAYRKMGSALPGDRQREEPAMLSGYAEMLRQAAKDAEGLQCDVCVELRPGKPPKVTVTHSSRRRAFDALAKEALALAARVRGDPAVAGVAPAGKGKTLEACYRFLATFHRVPPLPYVACSFDESKPSISCVYPTKKIISKGVRLIVVRVKS